MGKITQYSRLSHHTVSLTGFTGSTLFTVPPSEDFTNGTWTIYDLAQSEIGVWEEQERAFIRIGNDIKEFNLIPSGSSGSNIWISGSSGAYSIAANNPTGVDATANYAVAAGIGNLANGQGSVTFGRDNITRDDYTSAFGFNNTVSGITSFVGGNTLVVNGLNAAAFGFSNSIDGDGGFAAGYNNTITGFYSSTFGRDNNISSGSDNFAIGKSNVVSGSASYSEGNQNTSSGTNSHAEGSNNIASGDYSHTEGLQNTASGNGSHVGGNLSLASGLNSFAHGYLASATTTGATAIGFGTLASGENSFAGGSLSKLSGDNVIASGKTSFAFGDGAKAYGDNSVVFGSGIANGNISVSFNGGTANANGSVAIGGISNGLSSFSFGGVSNGTGSTSFNGVSNGDRSYAFGIGALTTNYGEFAMTNNPNGQYGFAILGNSIPPATSGSTMLLLDSTSPSLVFILPTGTSYMCLVTVNIIEGTGQTKEWRGNMLIKNIAGTTTAVGTTALVSTHGDPGLSSITASISANDTTDSLDIEVTVPTTTFGGIGCVAKIEYTKVYLL